MNKKVLKVVALAGVVGVLTVASFSKSFAASESCANGKGKWTGGVGEKVVYSKIVDELDDNYKIHGRVYVCNDFGKSNYNEDWTKGLGNDKDHRIYTSVDKGINVPGLTCDANYKDDYAEYGPY